MERRLQESSPQIKFLIMGDSHGFRAINADKIDSSFNYSMLGENNINTYYKLKKFLTKTEKRPKYILFPFDLTTFATASSEYEKNRFYYSSMIDYDELGKERNQRIKTTAEKISSSIFTYIELKEIILQIILSEETYRKNKKSIAENSLQKNIKDAKHFVEVRVLENDPKNIYNNVSVIYLKKTIALCENENIKPVFIKFPLTRYFLESVKNFVDETTIKNSLVEKIILSSESTIILDFQNVFLDCDECFFDSHHLNLNGREKFTELLKAKLDSLENTPK